MAHSFQIQNKHSQYLYMIAFCIALCPLFYSEPASAVSFNGAKNAIGRLWKLGAKASTEEIEQGLRIEGHAVATQEAKIITDQIYKNSVGVFSDFSMRLTAGDIPETVARSAEIESLATYLNDVSREVIVIEGRQGVGKTQVVAGLGARITKGNVPKNIKDSKIIEINVDNSNFENIGQFESYLKMLKEKYINQSFIFYFSRSHKFVPDSSVTRADFATYVERIQWHFGRGSKSRILLEGAEEEIAKVAEKNYLVKTATRLKIAPLAEADIKIVIKNHALLLEKNFSGVRISDDIINKADDLAKLYYANEGRPVGTIRLLNLAVSRKQMSYFSENTIISAELHAEFERLTQELTRVQEIVQKAAADGAVFARKRAREIPEQLKKIKDAIARADESFKKMKALRNEFSQISNATKGRNLTAEETRRLNEIRKEGEKMNFADLVAQVHEEKGIKISEMMLNKNVLTIDNKIARIKETLFGQDEAVEIVARAFERAKSLFRGNRKKPLDSMIFLGPTGVGKTQLALTASELEGRPLIRVNMSEYMDSTAANKLIGSSPGYIGYGEGHNLVDDVIRNPNAVILFDEIEKADPKVYDLFLQILDNASLTSGNGRIADFTNTLIVMTSNSIQKVEKGTNRAQLIERLFATGKFRHELLNRINHYVVFKQTGKEELISIVGRETEMLNKDLAERIINLEISNPAKEIMAAKILKATQGSGRDMVRAFEQEVKDRVDDILLYGIYKSKSVGADGVTRIVNHSLDVKEGDKIIVEYVSAADDFIFKIAKTSK